MVSQGYVVIAYFVSWAIYARNFNVWDIPSDHLTHINYAFANIQNGVAVVGDSWADKDKVFVDHGDTWNDPGDYLHGNFHQLYRLKQKNRNLKVGLSIGGWTWSTHYSEVAATDQSRQTFVASAIKLMLDFGLDYIDLDWEYPTDGGDTGIMHNPQDAQNFVLLVKEFKSQFSQYPDRTPQLTIAIPCVTSAYPKYQLKEMSEFVDYFNTMCYDFSGDWSPVADHQSNLLPVGNVSIALGVDSAIKALIGMGVPAQKIVLGVPFYGRSFAQCDGLRQPFVSDTNGTWGSGIYDYKQLPLAGCKELWETSAQASFCYDSGNRLLISYDTPTSVTYKMKYIKDNGLAGAMFWETSGDFAFNDTRSLINRIDRWLGHELDQTSNQLCYPMSSYSNIRESGGPSCFPANSSKPAQVATTPLPDPILPAANDGDQQLHTTSGL